MISMNIYQKTPRENWLNYIYIYIYISDGDVNCSFANSSEFYILNTSKQFKVNHKMWPW